MAICHFTQPVKWHTCQFTQPVSLPAKQVSDLAPTQDQRSKEKGSLEHKGKLEGSTAIGWTEPTGLSQSQAFPPIFLCSLSASGSSKTLYILENWTTKISYILTSNRITPIDIQLPSRVHLFIWSPKLFLRSFTVDFWKVLNTSEHSKLALSKSVDVLYGVLVTVTNLDSIRYIPEVDTKSSLSTNNPTSFF